MSKMRKIRRISKKSNRKIEHITDFSQIASYGVMSTPAFVLNGEVVSFGKVLSVDEVKHILSIKWKDQ